MLWHWSEAILKTEPDIAIPVVVGLVLGPTIGAEGLGERIRRIAVSDMLYAFAVECWLKGLIVASVRRSSPSVYDEYVEKSGALGVDLDESFQRLLDFAKHPDGHRLIEKCKLPREEENLTRTDRIPKRGHDLIDMADLAGVDLDEEGSAHLKFLQHMNQKGRYRTSKNPYDGDYAHHAGSETLRQSLGEAIQKRYHQIVVNDLPKGKGGA